MCFHTISGKAKTIKMFLQKKSSYITCLLCFFGFSHLIFINCSIAQDIHFSQFYFSPLSINPAQTGFFNADIRGAANYRNQWNFLPFPYNTYSASADMQITHNIFLIDTRVSGGIYFYGDKAGSGNIGSSAVMLSSAYHKFFDKGTKNLSFGLQAGVAQIGFDPTVLTFGDQIVNSSSSTIESFSSTNIKYLDINTGVLWNMIPSERLNIYAGLALFHLNRPKINFVNTSAENNLSRRVIVHGGSAFQINSLFDILPTFIYMKQDAAHELNVGTALRYKLDLQRAVRFGPWYRYWRNSDAITFMTGLDYYNFNFGISYDVNISLLKNVSKGKGAFEFSVIYIGLLPGTKRAQEGSSTKCPKF